MNGTKAEVPSSSAFPSAIAILSWDRWLLENLGIALVYWAVSHLNWLLFKSGGILPMPIWPGAAIAVAVTLLRGGQAGAGIALGSILANAFSLGSSWGTAAGIAVMNTLGPFWAATLLRKNCSRLPPFANLRDTMLFLAVGVALMAGLTATGGIVTRWMLGDLAWPVVPMAWLRWWLAHASAALLFGPVLLEWMRGAPPVPRPARLRLYLVSVLTLLLTFFLFTQLRHENFAFQNVPLLLIIPLAWVAVHYQVRESMTLQALVILVSMMAVVLGYGNPFGDQLPLVSLGFMGLCFSLVLLVIGASMEEKKHAELIRSVALQDLQQKTEELDRYFNSALDLLCIADTEGYFRKLNPEWERVLGYPIQGLIGRRFLDFVHPDDIESTLKAISLLSEQKAVLSFANRYLCRNGVYRWLEWRSFPCGRDIYAVARDVTARMETENRLRENDACLSQINHCLINLGNRFEENVLHITELCGKLFKAGCVIYFRREGDQLKNVGAWRAPSLCCPDPALESWLGQEVERRSPEGVVVIAEIPEQTVAAANPAVPPCALKSCMGTAARGGGVGFGYLCVLFWQEVTPSERDRQFLGLLASAVGNEEGRRQADENRHEMERRMQHVQKLESLGVLAGGIAHDFNNILMAVMGHADLALAELSPVAPAREDLEAIHQAALRATDLCRQMLAYSGKGRFVIEQINLSELVQEMVHLLQASISKKAALNLRLSKSLPGMEGDATQIRQIVMNLITNAAEALGEHSGVITVSTGAMHCTGEYLHGATLEERLADGEYVFVEVSDSGCGMSQETLSRIFEPFFSTKFTGRGLGLSAVLGIVRGHHGGIRIYSEVNKGTTFKILFPVSGGEVQKQVNGADELEQWRWQKGGSVLLVDDEPLVRTTGRKMLERLGLSVLTAVDGRDALSIYDREHSRIRFVLLDLTMPNMDGEEAFRELRRANPEVQVILTSGYTEQEVTARFAGKGLAGFIQKPFSLKSLSAKLRDLSRAV